MHKMQAKNKKCKKILLKIFQKKTFVKIPTKQNLHTKSMTKIKKKRIKMNGKMYKMLIKRTLRRIKQKRTNFIIQKICWLRIKKNLHKKSKKSKYQNRKNQRNTDRDNLTIINKEKTIMIIVEKDSRVNKKKSETWG